MEVRRLTQTDCEAHEKLASQAFVFPCNISKNAVLPTKTMLGAFLPNGKLAADMEIIDRECFYDNSVLSCAAVGGVASKPEYRNSGAVKAVFNSLFDSSVLTAAYDVCVLYPFSTAFYQKLGFAPIGKKLKITVPFSQFKTVERSNDVVLFEGQNPDELLTVYNGYANTFALSFRRNNTAVWNSEPYSSNVYTYIWLDENGNYRSYATFTLDRDLSLLSVKELVFSDKKSLLGILGFLRCFEGNFDSIVFLNEPENTPVLGVIYDLKKAKIEYSTAGAVRILDYENVLKKHNYGNFTGSFVLRIKNADSFEISCENGKAEIVRTEKSPDITLNDAAAAKLLFEGAVNGNELEFYPGIEISGNADKIAAAFNYGKIFFNDDF